MRAGGASVRQYWEWSGFRHCGTSREERVEIESEWMVRAAPPFESPNFRLPHPFAVFEGWETTLFASRAFSELRTDVTLRSVG